MKRAQLFVKKAAAGPSYVPECRQDVLRRMSLQLTGVGWTEPQLALEVTALQHTPPVRQPAAASPAPEAGHAEHIFERYFPQAGAEASALAEGALADRRGAWEDVVVARHLLPELGAELLVLEGHKTLQ